MKSITFTILTILFLAPCSYADLITNGDFETHDLGGWTLNNASFGGVTTNPNTPVPAYTGSQFAFITSGNGNGVYTTLTQSFNFSAGETISGWVQIYTTNRTPGQDDVYATIVGLQPPATWTGTNPVTTLHPETISYWGNTPWTELTWTAANAGQYTVQFGVRGFSEYSTALFIDHIEMTPAEGSAAPEPLSCFLFAVGAAALAFKKKKSALG